MTPFKSPFYWMLTGLGVAVLVSVAWLLLSGRTEPLTRERLAAAERLWQAADITSYDMDLQTGGAMPGKYHIEVHGGELTKLERNGRPANPAEGEYWTLDGLFRIIEQDLDEADRAEAATADRRFVWLRGRFDPQLGYPVHYIKQVPGQPSVEIRVRRFEQNQ